MRRKLLWRSDECRELSSKFCTSVAPKSVMPAEQIALRYLIVGVLHETASNRQGNQLLKEKNLKLNYFVSCQLRPINQSNGVEKGLVKSGGCHRTCELSLKRIWASIHRFLFPLRQFCLITIFKLTSIIEIPFEIPKKSTGTNKWETDS